LSSYVGVFYFLAPLFSVPTSPVKLSPNSFLAFLPSFSISKAISGKLS